MLVPRWLAAVPILWAAVYPAPVFAYREGISGYSGEFGSICNACHTGGIPPTVSFTGPPMLDTKQTGDFIFTVQSAAPKQQFEAGFDVGTNAGMLVKGSDSQLLPAGCKAASCDVTHLMPKRNDASGKAAWAFQWTAPGTPGNYILWGAGNSVDNSGDQTGDAAAGTMIFVAVGGVATVTPTVPPTPTPSRTRTQASTPTSTPTGAATSTPTSSPTVSATASTTSVATHTPTASSTPSETASPLLASTDTPTPTDAPTDTPSPIASDTPTVTATPSVVADANCDDSVTVADVSALVRQLAMNTHPTCGADVDANGRVDQGDIALTILALFSD